MSVLAIDAGTTGVTALVVTEDGRIESRGYEEFAQHFPEPGRVEHNPEDIWQATLSACAAALRAATSRPACLGITNQRETAVLWDRRTLAAPRRAIVWQDRRTAGICERLRSAGHEPRVSELTGLRLDPYFTASKLTWLAEHDRSSWEGVLSGEVAVGTVDSYLIARLTGGARHVTDPSNASRTLLYGLASGSWEPELCELFGVPETALPEIVPSYGALGQTDPGAFLGLGLPISGVAGDQQAALFGQTCFRVGEVKCTYGTGSFILANTGGEIVRSDAGLLTSVAWQTPSGDITYALEGSVFVTGAAVQWLRDGLGLIGTAPESEAVARTVPDSGGVVFVPALTGLGAPYWDPEARGLITGITRGTTRAHLVRATLEAIAFEVRDVVEVMTGGVMTGGVMTGGSGPVLKADGGASGNDLLMQLQADQLGTVVERPVVQETTALGAAFLAGLGSGVWESADELRETWRLDRRFEPGARDDAAYERWRTAVALASTKG
ncbi:FGGY family carbohydrate kinase [Nonomuraea aurantiaca]|uniref:FGGY family carbohydrate kinase n=1 Tax=Nonomuraea aurantiaca TaxID=2878562 RepID=UPI001CDA21D2|nr:glycerol kinase [Nonomuraea aurantiaca]MCA2226872.1 glycerol kinase [Nonomuraea aurantiaca]